MVRVLRLLTYVTIGYYVVEGVRLVRNLFEIDRADTDEFLRAMRALRDSDAEVMAALADIGVVDRQQPEGPTP